MKKYAQNPAVHEVYLPKKGRLAPGEIVEGDEYAKLVPKFLVEVPEMPEGAPLETTMSPSSISLTEPAPSGLSAPPPPPAVSEGNTLTEEDSKDPPQKGSRNSKK